jgi:hypothetical protein
VSTDWVRCYAATMEPEAHLVRGFLEGRGVPCLLRALGPSVYPVATFGTEVLVPVEWLRIAEQLLRRRRRPTRRVLRLPAKRKHA